MKFASPLIEAKLLRRYKRFLADVLLDDGRTVTVHSANTGAMLGCSTPGSRIWISTSANPKRRYPQSWEITETAPSALVGVNPIRANRLVREGIEKGRLSELQGYGPIRAEVPFGDDNSRVDLLLEDAHGHNCYVEVKSVTAVDQQVAIFPDAVTERGTRHLRALMSMVHKGYRAVLCFCIQRYDVNAMAPAVEIDPVYGETLRLAVACGVEVLAYKATVQPCAIELKTSVPLIL